MATVALEPSLPPSGHKTGLVVPEIIAEMRREVKRLAAPLRNVLAGSACGSHTWDEEWVLDIQQLKQQQQREKHELTKVPRRNKTGRSPKHASGSAPTPIGDIDHMRHLWRAHRKKMFEERQTAIADEERISSECHDALVKGAEEQNEELRLSMVLGDSLFEGGQDDEPSTYEVILPPGFKSSSTKKTSLENPLETEQLPCTSHGSFWDMFNIFFLRPGNQNQKGPPDDAAQTVVTSDETTCFSRTRSMESEVSWQSWNSVLTEKACNAAAKREYLARRFGGDNDDPWLAAKRGDLETLVRRWKNRHDWTLQNEDGDVPLYLACRYGGAKDPRVVLFLLQQWPSSQHIPPALIGKCIEDAVNVHVEEIMLHPNQAELIIRDYQEHVLDKVGTGNQRLHGINEEQEDDIELNVC
jgi:hypothetical protein